MQGDKEIEEQGPSFAACWWSLPQDLQGRILGEIDDERRCSIIPCASRELYRLHTEFPPRRKVLAVEGRVGTGKLKWFSSIASSLEHLVVEFWDDTDGEARPNLLPTILLLQMAVTASPRLRKLRLHGANRAIVAPPVLISTMISLTQLTSLELDGLWVLHRDALPQLRHITALQLLKELKAVFALLSTYLVAITQPDESIWTALSKLRSLESAELRFLSKLQMTAVLQPISLVTQLRSLDLIVLNSSRNEGAAQPATLKALTKLTKLNIGFIRFTFPDFVDQIWSLPSLKYLRFDFHGNERGNIVFQKGPPHCMAVRGHAAASIINARCLRVLKNLHIFLLLKQSASSFTTAIAAALKSLTDLILDLEDCTRLPAAVSQITTLMRLDLTHLDRLVLQESDIAVLAALPELVSLVLASAPSSKIADALQRRLPRLRLEVSSHH